MRHSAVRNSFELHWQQNCDVIVRLSDNGEWNVDLQLNYAQIHLAMIVQIHWNIVYFAEDAWAIILARFLTGVTGGGIFICIPLFVAEIANEQ